MNNKFQDAYEDFRDSFTELLVNTVHDNPLDRGDSPNLVTQQSSAFVNSSEDLASPYIDSQSSGAATSARSHDQEVDHDSQSASSMAQIAYFIVAARRDELEGIGCPVESYDAVSPRGWKPFLSSQDSVDYLVQDAVRRSGVPYSEYIDPHQELAKKLNRAQANRQIVIGIVDGCSLLIEGYRQLISDGFDTVGLYNCVVVVPECDATTSPCDEVMPRLNQAFQVHLGNEDTQALRTGVSEPMQFEHDILTAINLVQSRFNRNRELGREVGPPQQMFRPSNQQES
jgi:hypothetical protein